jgi:hypothetical protein
VCDFCDSMSLEASIIDVLWTLGWWVSNIHYPKSHVNLNTDCNIILTDLGQPVVASADPDYDRS